MPLGIITLEDVLEGACTNKYSFSTANANQQSLSGRKSTTNSTHTIKEPNSVLSSHQTSMQELISPLSVVPATLTAITWILFRPPLATTFTLPSGLNLDTDTGLRS